MERRGRPVIEEAVQELERKLGLELPNGYRNFLLDINGGRTARSHCVFVIQRQEKQDETVLNSLFSLDDCGPEDTRDLALAQTHYSPDVALPIGLLEIGYDGMGGRIVLALVGPHRGEVWYLNMEDDSEDQPLNPDLPPVEWFDRRDVWKVADSFYEFMAELRPLD